MISTKPTAMSVKPTAVHDGTALSPGRTGVQGSATRKIALVTGILMLITFITSIPAQLIFYHPLLTDTATFILGGGTDTSVQVGALMEALLVIANVGTAVVLYPIVKRQNEIVALGFIMERVLEGVAIMVGFFSLLATVTLRQDAVGAGGATAASLVTAGKALVAVHDWTFLIGPGFLDGLGTGLFLGYLMYRSGLMPRGLALFGLIGGPLVMASGIAVLFGVFKAGGAEQFIATIPEIVWELSVGFYLLVKGFKPSPLTSRVTDAALSRNGS